MKTNCHWALTRKDLNIMDLYSEKPVNIHPWLKLLTDARAMVQQHKYLLAR